MADAEVAATERGTGTADTGSAGALLSRSASLRMGAASAATSECVLSRRDACFDDVCDAGRDAGRDVVRDAGRDAPRDCARDAPSSSTSMHADRAALDRTPLRRAVRPVRLLTTHGACDAGEVPWNFAAIS